MNQHTPGFSNPYQNANMLVGKMSYASAGPTGSGRSAGLHPQSGTRKLVIKNLRISPRSSLPDHYNRLWNDIKTALVDIYDGRQPQQPLELLYRDVEDICRNGQAEELYHQLNSKCTACLQNNLLPGISDGLPDAASTIETLKAVYNTWETWNTRSVTVPGHVLMIFSTNVLL
jgi:cullin-4